MFLYVIPKWSYYNYTVLYIGLIPELSYFYNARIYGSHFQPTDHERNLKNESLNLPPPKHGVILRADIIPTHYLPVVVGESNIKGLI